MASKPSAVDEVASSERRHWSDDRARIRLYSGAGLFVTLAVFAIWSYQHFFVVPPKLGPIGLDFLPFWGASYFVLHGHPLDAYNVDLMTSAQMAAQPWTAKLGGIMPWLYPPVMMILLAPVALLPFSYAYAAYACIGFGLYYAALRRTAPWRDARLPTMSFPGVLLVIAAGQIALYTTALAGFSLLLLRKRPAWAGALAGLLFVKPHVALLFPLAFLCAREWRALAACIAVGIGSTLLAGVVFGLDVYPTFLHATALARQSLVDGEARLARMPTFFVMARMLGAPVTLAAIVHAGVALGAVAAMIDVWRRPAAFALRAATLVCATTLVSPYLYDYDLAMLSLVIAWYVRDGIARGWLRGEREWLVVLWLTPAFGLIGVPPLGFQFMPLITLATLAMLWRRRRRLAHVPEMSDVPAVSHVAVPPHAVDPAFADRRASATAPAPTR
ncbi:glycosyltransferase family 87 protein [Pandoraea sp. 64-18]|uniref:glycosyltransferase family 87 protein n=1 Tax=Pandoraea sp. 64-18 TaxID=1895806 RepID=UPI00095C5B8A|nr:glycosyltransferase family 87 protein [Pandoraea sp. 64-18]OJY22419.1 MAG: hypothetical protein BGP02_01110 [Pandoraea sp. 64-18]